MRTIRDNIELCFLYLVTFKLIIIYNIPNRDVCIYAKCISLYFKNIFCIHNIACTTKHIIHNIIQTIKNNYINENKILLVTSVVVV